KAAGVTWVRAHRRTPHSSKTSRQNDIGCHDMALERLAFISARFEDDAGALAYLHFAGRHAGCNVCEAQNAVGGSGPAGTARVRILQRIVAINHPQSLAISVRCANESLSMNRITAGPVAGNVYGSSRHVCCKEWSIVWCLAQEMRPDIWPIL